MADTLKKILDNQKKLIDVVDSHGKALKELAREAKKMRKTRASKESVKELLVEVERLKVDHLPLDLLLHDPAPAAQPQPEQSERPPKRKRVIPQSDDAVIQLVDPSETSSSQPQDAAQEPVQAQVPIAKPQITGSQSQVLEHREHPGAQREDLMQTDGP